MPLIHSSHTTTTDCSEITLSFNTPSTKITKSNFPICFRLLYLYKENEKIFHINFALLREGYKLTIFCTFLCTLSPGVFCLLTLTFCYSRTLYSNSIYSTSFRLCYFNFHFRVCSAALPILWAG